MSPPHPETERRVQRNPVHPGTDAAFPPNPQILLGVCRFQAPYGTSDATSQDKGERRETENSRNLGSQSRSGGSLATCTVRLLTDPVFLPGDIENMTVQKVACSQGWIQLVTAVSKRYLVSHLRLQSPLKSQFWHPSSAQVSV